MSCQKNLFLFLFLVFSVNLFSQNDAGKINERKQSISVFLDCGFCDEEYIRQNLTFINYVRDTKEAQVHILGTWQSTGGGGNEYTFFFIGQKNFEGMKDTLIVNTSNDASKEETREKQIRAIKMGLIRYVAKTPVADKIDIDYRNAGENEGEEEIVEDKWKSWVFNVGANAWFNGQESYTSLSFGTSAVATKVTPDIKVEFEFDYDYDEDKFVIGEEEIISTNERMEFYHLLVKSINDHWSVGYDMSGGTSVYSNLDFYGAIYPGIEYNLFPYSESSRRQLRFLYGIGSRYNDYTDTTIYNQTEELLWQQRLTIAFEIQEKWGSVTTSVRGSNYFHDFAKNNLIFRTSLRLRIVKGLQLRLFGSFAFIHDQLSLPKGGASEEEILLRRKELATQYRYWGSAGIYYTFGSIYNNVVNPRFGN